MAHQIEIEEEEISIATQNCSCAEIITSPEKMGKNHYSYSVTELEALRFWDLKEQLRTWIGVRESLVQSEIIEEYDGLQAPDHQSKKKQKNKNKKRKKEERDAAASAPTVLEAPNMEPKNGVKMEDEGMTEDEHQNVDERMNNCKQEYHNGKCWRYSRTEMEALRFVEVESEERLWQEVCNKLSSDIVEECDKLISDRRNQHEPRNVCQQQSAGKIAGSYEHLGKVVDVKSPKGHDGLNVCGGTLNYNGNGTDVEEPWDEYENINDEYDSSSDEYDSIKRPAFLVEGEPDFESGPPLDGLEYLRRVRWEAAQIPKVKVVRLNSSKHTSEQTPYMPSIPDIPKCPPNLLPSKDWENAFLAKFSELRQEISVLQNSYNESSLKADKGLLKQQDLIQQMKKNPPTLTAISGMDAVSRAATLRKHISSLETNNSFLSRNDCLWLFALCAAVDTPLHGDTCASLRCLLRKCLCLLAQKSERDDEVAMLSILVIVAGKYFGQSDNL